jgi:hypothetical protein
MLNDAASDEKMGRGFRYFPSNSAEIFFSRILFLRLHENSLFSILLQRGIAIFDCEAAALPGRFLPELGRSSERPFFLRGSFGRTIKVLAQKGAAV